MKLNIDFDEFKEYIKNRKNAETLLEKKTQMAIRLSCLRRRVSF